MRLIDADALVKVPNVNWVYEYDETGCAMQYKAVPLAAIEAAPTIEAAPVVRCKDCKHRGTSYDCPFRRIVFTEAEGYHYDDCTMDDSFCSFGEKKEEEK
jgi:predicted RNA-binding Zn-ribbon protein involved in translation (DUF1610 family)